MNETTSIRQIIRAILTSALVVLGLIAFSSCTATQRGAVIGGLGGAGIGAAVADDAGKGALIGGAIGAAGGAAIGSARDRRYYDYHYGRPYYGRSYYGPRYNRYRW